MKGSSREISHYLQSLEYGGHDLVIYPNLDSFRGIYSGYIKSTACQDEILVIVSQYETLDGVRDTLKKHGVADVKSHENNGSLVIVDSAKAYQRDVQGAPKLAKTLVARAAKEKKKGVSVLADMGSFTLYEKVHALVEYGSSLPKKFDVSLKGFCCYNKKDFDVLSAQQKKELFTHHEQTITIKN